MTEGAVTRILVDTNMVLRFVDEKDPRHALVSDALMAVFARGDHICIVSQVVYEFWAVATRPSEVNGLGWSPQVVRTIFERLLELFLLVPDPEQLFSTWLDLVTTYGVSGKPTHDARLAAAARAHAFDALLTLNPDHFKRFGVQVLTPADL